MPSPDLADVVLVIDLHNVAWRAYYSPMPKKLVNGYPTYHVLSVLYRVGSCLEFIHRQYPDCGVCLAVSSDEYYPRKKALFPEYKSGRSGKEDELETYEVDGVKVRIDPVGDAIKALRYIPHCDIGIPSRDEETDDIIATFIAKHRDRLHFVVSSDKDLWQLRRKNVKIVKSETPIVLVTVDDIIEKFHTTDSRLIPMVKTMIGDSSDKLVGVPRFPKKLFDPMTYEDYAGDVCKGITYLTGKASEKVAAKITADADRLVSLHSIIALRRDLEISETVTEGDRKKFNDYLEDREIQAPKIMKAWG